MRRTLLRMAPVLHLTRVTTAFSAVANVWFVILWTRASSATGAQGAGGGSPLVGLDAPGGFLAGEPGMDAVADEPLWLLLAGGAVNALGLFALAAAVNDILDARRDRTLNPDRPLPSGRMSLDAAVALVVLTFTAAVLGATALGIRAVLLTLLVAGAVLFFNAAGKFVPAVGLVVLGLIYAGQMVVPNLGLRFVWPVWLVMTHSLAVAAWVHIVGRKAPAISRRAVGFSAAGWLFWTGVMVYASTRRSGLWPGWVRPSAALGPALLALLFVLVARLKLRNAGPGKRSAEKIARYGALWLALYACAWLFGQGYTHEGMILSAVTAAGFLGMTVLRELYALLEHPLGYRR